MYRLYGALGVLLSVVVLITAGYMLNTKTADKMLALLNEAYQLADAGEMTEAKKRVEQAKNELDSKIEGMLLFVSHGRLDRIEEAINKAYEYIDKNDLSLFMAECSSAILMTEHFINVENPYINNIF